MPRRAYNNRDDNEPALLDTLDEMKAEWVEAGPLDGWVFVQHWIPVEIKNPEGKSRPGRKGEFRQKQIDFIAKCKLTGRPYLVWRTSEDVIDTVNALRRRAT